VCVVIAIIAVRTALYNQCYLVMCCVLSCFLMPLLFLFCGGITSGMPLYCITSLSLIAFASRGKSKQIAFVVSLIVQATTIALSWIRPEFLATQLDRNDAYLDILVTHILTGFTLFATGSLSIKAYSQERQKTKQLLAKLDYLSMRDPLTGLYNRRYLLNYLENSVWRRRSEFYLAMLDLDDFKRINRDFSHDFGDEVICTVGKALQKYEDEIAGECTARFGCEKFIYVISAGSEVEAFAIRQHPELRPNRRRAAALCLQQNKVTSAWRRAPRRLVQPTVHRNSPCGANRKSLFCKSNKNKQVQKNIKNYGPVKIHPFLSQAAAPQRTDTRGSTWQKLVSTFPDVSI
jgi:GGDEF domain-containing protein